MIQPVAPRPLPKEEVLYKNKRVIVTPSWLQVKNTSYAVRYIQKYSLKMLAPPRISAGIVFFVAVGLTVWQLYRIKQQMLPTNLGWAMLALCILLLLGSSFVAFVMQTRYRLDINFSDDAKTLQIVRTTRADIEALRTAISIAMDWYQAERNNILIDANVPPDDAD